MRHLSGARFAQTSACAVVWPEARFSRLPGLLLQRPSTCTGVCPNNPRRFAAHISEIKTFDLERVERARPFSAPDLPDVVPIIYHNGQISSLPKLPAACLSLHQLYYRRQQAARFKSPDQLRSTFGLSQSALVLLTGVAQDKSVEAWWELTRTRRREIIKCLLDQQVAFVTTPNFSLTVDEPRWNDLHALMRGAIAYVEFLELGLPAAYHVNARTDRDYERVASFIANRPEITHVAVEFLTGAGASGRCDWHEQQLSNLSTYVGRPLHLTYRGRSDQVSKLARAFPNLTILDADPFMKTMHRQLLVANGNRRLRPKSVRTSTPQELGLLFDSNLATKTAYLRDMRHAA